MILYNNIFQTGSTGNAPIKITVAELKALADASQLDVNAIYQITDYQITNFISDLYSSTEHYFDILVTPYNKQKINASAAATKHEGDTYYNEIDLRSWKLEYFIKDCTYGYEDNIIATEFQNTNNPYGVITYLCDHSNNQAYFDFKNIAINGYMLFEGYDHIDYSQHSINGISCVKNCSMLSIDYLTTIFSTEDLVNLFPQCKNITLTGPEEAIIIHDNSVQSFDINNFTLRGYTKISEVDSMTIQDCRFVENQRGATGGVVNEYAINIQTPEVLGTTIMSCTNIIITGYINCMLIKDITKNQIDGDFGVDIYQGRETVTRIIS